MSLNIDQIFINERDTQLKEFKSQLTRKYKCNQHISFFIKMRYGEFTPKVYEHDEKSTI